MGDTRDALIAGGGMAYQWVVAVEGYDTVITDGSTSAALTAWADTDHTAAVNGLVLQWADGQRVRPWSKELDVPIMSFGVQPDGTDAFGKLVGARMGGVETILDIEPGLTTTTITVLSTAAFPSSGTIHIGTEAIGYASKTSTEFTLCTRGMFSPGVELDIGGWARPHSIPVVSQGVAQPIYVTSQIRDWRGRIVTVWLHRKVGGVLDVRTEAERVFVGRVIGTRYDAQGWTWVDVENLNAVIRSKELLHDQWSAKVREGIYLPSGAVFTATDTLAGATLTADPLEVIASGAAGHLEINEGTYSLDEIAGFINEWLQGEKDAANLGATWTFNHHYVDDDGAWRTAFLISGGATENFFKITMPAAVKRFLGFSGADLESYWYGSGTKIYKSPNTPRRILIYENNGLPLEDPRGTAFDNESFAPPETVAGVNGTVLVVQLDSGAMFAAELESANRLVDIHQSDMLDRLSGVPWTGVEHVTEVLADDDRELRLRQVAIVGASFKNLVMYLLASTGGDSADVNGTDYDKLPLQLGCGIPLELISSLATDLDSAQGGLDDRILVVTKPTKVWDVLWGEFTIRASALVWKNGVLRLGSWSTPTAATGEHDFDEDNKAEPAGTASHQRTVATEEDAYVVNVVTVYFDRVLTGSGETYRSDFTIKDIAAMEATGERKAEIKLPCTFEASPGAIDSLMADMAAWLPLFTRPVFVLNRSIDVTKYVGCAPCDQGLLDDNHIRDPETGERGISDKPVLVLGHTVKWPGFGVSAEQVSKQDAAAEVELLMFNRDRVFAYCPCAQVDDTQANGGYSAGGPSLICYAHEHSESSQPVDASHFAANDVIRIVEIDPVDLANPTTWVRTILSVSSNTITLTSTLSSPAWDSAKKYRIIADNYADVQATQATKSFQADADDYLIEDERGPYEYGWQTNTAVTWTDDTDTAQVDLPADLSSGDGAALDVGYERSAWRLANNAVNYRLGGACLMSLGAVGAGTTSQVRSIIRIEEICLGKMGLQNGDRLLWERPFFRSSDGTSATVYVSLCRGLPMGGSRHIADADNPGYSLGATFETQSWNTSSTTWAAGAAASFSLSILDSEGHGYIVYEVSEKAETRGPSTRRIGPYMES